MRGRENGSEGEEKSRVGQDKAATRREADGRDGKRRKKLIRNLS